MATTRLQIRFRVRGRDLDPEAITDATGVSPSRSFRRGERPRPTMRERDVAGWDWTSEWADTDLGGLITEMMASLEPHRELFRGLADSGSDITLTVVGEVFGDLITSETEARLVGWSGGDGRGFRPFIVSDRPDITLDPSVMEFLAAI